MSKRATVSAALIVKDEEATLEKCLKSIRDVVDEIVVLVDDSTTDNTYQIAKKYGDIVEFFRWENDFSKARNLSMSKCTKDWILIMDGHEILHPASKMVLQNLMERVNLPSSDKMYLGDALFFSGYAYMYTKIPETEQEIRDAIPEVFFLQPRLFRRSEFGLNDGQLHYEGKSHNYIVGGSKELKKYPVKELVFIHARTEENAKIRAEQRQKVNIKNLLEDIKKNPEKARPYFYLAQTYLEGKDYENAKKYYREYLKRSKWGDERTQALIALATILADEEKYTEAQKYALQAITERWDRAEPYMLLGDIAFQLKDLYQAEHWYRAASEMKPPFSSLFLHGPTYSYLPYERLCRVYDATRQWEKAIECGLKVLEMYPKYEMMRDNIALWSRNLGINPERRSIVFLARGDTFIKPIAEELSQDYNVQMAHNFYPDILKTLHREGDVLWFEWCDGNIIEATKREKPPGQKWIVRLHSYESYTNMPNMVNWDKVDRLIYVAEHIKRKVEKRFGKRITCPSVVIHNGVDYQNYSFAIRKPGYNIAFAGIFSWKKGIQLLVQTLRYLIKKDPRYTLHARIDFFEGDSTVRQAADYWDYCYPELKDNIRFYPKREASLDGWLEDMNFILHTSTVEAFGYVIAEAMCKGIKPLIYDWEGAREVWPEGDYDSRRYREYVIKNYSRESQLKKIKKLLEEL